MGCEDCKDCAERIAALEERVAAALEVARSLAEAIEGSRRGLPTACPECPAAKPKGTP